MAPSVLTQLDVETRAHHDAADAPWLELLLRDVTLERYIALLVRTYGFEAPLEAALAYTPGLGALLDLRARWRAGLIAQDLLVLDVAPSAIANIPQSASIAPFATTTQALGWLYVVERSSRIHEVVAEHVVRWQPRCAGARTYLCAYRSVREQRWRELGEVLEQVRPSTELIAAAHEAFRTAQHWYAGDAGVTYAASMYSTR
jgi:heme oxygenase